MEKVDKTEIAFHLAMYFLMVFAACFVLCDFWHISKIFLHVALAAAK